MDRLQKFGAAGIGAYAGWKMLDQNLGISHDLAMKGVRDFGDTIMTRSQEYVTSDLWDETVARQPNKDAIVFEDVVYSYEQVDKLANKVSNWALDSGIKPKSVVAFMMENRPEYLITWLGLLKIGVMCAHINTNIKGKPLSHSIQTANCTAVLVGSELCEVVVPIQSTLNLPVFVCGPDAKGKKIAIPSGMKAFNVHECQASDAAPSKDLKSGVTRKDPWGFIYTSGTTGLPKACYIPHGKYMGAVMLAMALGLKKEDDRCYTVLPLYHSAGGMIGGSMFIHGVTLILRRKFSARMFWSDCIQYRATVVQYIGELCRYLLSSPPTGFDKAHQVRVAIGNGLRPEIWDEFQDRFNIPEIGEFYGATEANIALMNHCTTPSARGAVGRLGWLGRTGTGVTIVDFNVETEELVRNKEGFCTEVPNMESGEMLVLINEKQPFVGYTDAKASSKKIAENVFKKGDKYFRTGDLLRRDRYGYFYFVDRIGDTFRWKGENVSTMEVSEVLSTYPGITEANVYGAQIEGKDGRACMVALVTDKPVDAKDFAKYCIDNLPSYSVPVFVRFLPEMEITGTFKHRKVELKKEGFNPSEVEDKMWFYNADTKGYVPLTPEVYSSILSGKSKL